MKTSTNALTKRYCATREWPCATVQSFYGGRRHDLFGIADSLIACPSGLRWVQNCSYGTLKAHRSEIEKNPLLPWIDDQRVWLELWEWRKKKVGRKALWFLRGQRREGEGWTQVCEWSEPMDLYPKKP